MGATYRATRDRQSGRAEALGFQCQGEPIISVLIVCLLYLLSTTSEFMAVNLRGRGRSPEDEDGSRLP